MIQVICKQKTRYRGWGFKMTRISLHEMSWAISGNYAKLGSTGAWYENKRGYWLTRS